MFIYIFCTCHTLRLQATEAKTGPIDAVRKELVIHSSIV